MAELQLYNSQGDRIDTDNPEVSPRIENFFFGGVRLYVKETDQIELVAFFRARKSKSSRAEQFYAVYNTNDRDRLFSRFLRQLRDRVEGNMGMSLQTSSDDVQLFTLLDESHTPPGTDTERNTLLELLRDGKQIRIGVGTNADALGLLEMALNGAADSVAVAEKADIEELNDCQLTIEVGSYSGLEPLGDTEALFAEKEQESMDSSPRSSRPRATGSTSDETDKMKTIGMPIAVVFGTFVALFVLLLIGSNVAAIAGVDTSIVDPIVFV